MTQEEEKVVIASLKIIFAVLAIAYLIIDNFVPTLIAGYCNWLLHEKHSTDS